MGKRENLIPSLILTEDQTTVPKRGGKYASKAATKVELEERVKILSETLSRCDCNCDCDCNCNCDREEEDCCNY